MAMYDTLMNDMKGAMKAHEMSKVNTLRGVIAKAVKQREESIAQFTAAGRAELAENERAEMEILKVYLPAQLSEEEVAAVVKAVVAETGAASKKDMGRVMKEVMARVKGQADGKLVSKLVGAALP